MIKVKTQPETRYFSYVLWVKVFFYLKVSKNEPCMFTPNTLAQSNYRSFFPNPYFFPAQNLFTSPPSQHINFRRHNELISAFPGRGRAIN